MQTVICKIIAKPINISVNKNKSFIIVFAALRDVLTALRQSSWFQITHNLGTEDCGETTML